MVSAILFILGFPLLIKGADLLVDGASSVARKFNISSLVIGLTIVAFGTSAPELIVNILASAQGNTEIAIGNVLGSNIANIFLILGIAAVIYPLATKENTVWKEIPLSLLAAILLGILANDAWIDGDLNSGLTRIDGLVFIAFFIIFLYYTFGISKVTGPVSSETDIKKLSILKSSLYILMGLLGLLVGGKWIVDGAVKMAEAFNISQSVIGLTIVAIGTSLPELATSAVAAYKKQTDIAIGNVVGSNIFNIFWILGCSALIRPLPFSDSSNFDILVAISASLVLFLIMFVGKKHVIERWQGGVMIFIYLCYLAVLITGKAPF
ncbi:calcium/sodium antiporter [Candidatus Peregrinibacteria bacterium]|nr:MAG: calcium/sodium antiporter [Candidatus Peregrinibacteria bacterium]